MNKAKFVQTEIGLIPDDWEVRALGEICDVRDGTHDSPIYYDFGYPFITSKNLINGMIDFNDIQYISKNDYDKINERSKVDKNDILFSMIGTIGKSVLVLQEPNFAIKNVALFKNINKCNQVYLKQYLDSDICYSRMNEDAKGSTQTFIPLGYFRTFLVPFPPLAEQQRIAKALSDVDALISTTEKLLQKKRNIKQGMMQELLTGKKRLPGFTKSNNTKITELGEIPEDWEVKKLGEFTRIQAGGTPSTLFEEYWNGNIRWMNSGELNMKRVYEVEGRITELGLANSSTHLFPKNCVLIGLAGQGKTRGTAAINYVELCTNQSIAAIFPSFSHNSEFLYQNIDNRYNELRELSDGGGGRGGLNLKIIGNLEIALPPKEEQNSIAKILSDMDNEIDLLNTKLEKYRNLKTAMMQQLLTGKIRLV